MHKAMARQTVIRGRHITHVPCVALGIVVFSATPGFGQTAIRDREMYPLSLGETVERNIKEGDHHTYSIELQSGQALRPDARERRAHLILILSKLDGNSAVAISADGFGRATLTYVATQAGQYGIKVSASKYQAQLALFKGESAARPTPMRVDADGAGRSSLVIVKRGGDAQKREATRAEVVYVAEEDAPLFKTDDKRPFAHPYYWAPFILIGNWR